jgi:hypothetical protein
MTDNDPKLAALLTNTPNGWIAAHRDSLPRAPRVVSTAEIIAWLPLAVRDGWPERRLRWYVGLAMRSLGARKRQVRNHTGVRRYEWTLPNDFL